jgi:hypothetical protein
MGACGACFVASPSCDGGFVVPADPLREKLNALMDEMAASPILALHGYAHALAALLAESEPAEDAKRIVAQAMNGAKVPPGYQQVRKGEV